MDSHLIGRPSDEEVKMTSEPIPTPTAVGGPVGVDKKIPLFEKTTAETEQTSGTTPTTETAQA